MEKESQMPLTDNGRVELQLARRTVKGKEARTLGGKFELHPQIIVEVRFSTFNYKTG